MPSARLGEALACIATAASELPESVIEAVATTLEALSGAPLTSHHTEALVKGIPGPSHRLRLTAMFRCLSAAGHGLPPTAIAWALRGALAQDTHRRAREGIELVWTGPETPAFVPRRASGALIEVIDRSRSALYLATFAAYRIEAVQEAIGRAVQRGVTVRLILEDAVGSGGKVRFDPLPAVAGPLTQEVEVYAWPKECRATKNQGRHGSLHMKCALADAELILVSSANLTEYAFDLNMELGVLIRSPDLGARLARHFQALIDQGQLRKL